MSGKLFVRKFTNGPLMADELWQWLRSLDREFVFLLSLAVFGCCGRADSVFRRFA